MKFNRTALLLLLAAAASGASASTLVGSAPAADSRAAGAKSVTLDFSDPLDSKKSGASLVMIAMPGMADHPPMRMSALKPRFANGNRTITLAGKAPLASGTYRAEWFATDLRGKRTTGRFGFTVP